MSDIFAVRLLVAAVLVAAPAMPLPLPLPLPADVASASEKKPPPPKPAAADPCAESKVKTACRAREAIMNFIKG